MWWKVIGGLLALWLVIAVAGALVGVVIEGLFWLAIIAGVLFVGTAAIGWVRKDRNQLK